MLPGLAGSSHWGLFRRKQGLRSSMHTFIVQKNTGFIFMSPLHFIIEHISAKLFVLNHDSSLISLVDFTCPAYSPGDRRMLHSWQFDREDQCHIQLDVLKALREIAQISRKRQDDFFK